MYFILKEGKRRYQSGTDTDFFASLGDLIWATEPQDFQHRDYYVLDTDGFEYDVAYISEPNSINISKGERAYSSVEDLLKEFFLNNQIEYDPEKTINENVTHASEAYLLQILDRQTIENEHVFGNLAAKMKRWLGKKQ